jgi:integrase
MATMKKVVWKDGTVSYKISFIHPHNNKWTSKSVRCSYKDALKIKADIEKDVAFGKIGKENPDFRKVFFSQLKTKYIKDSKRNKTTKTTEREEIVLANFTEYLKEDLELSKITQEKIDGFKDLRLDNDKKPATVSIEIRVLKTMFNRAIDWGLIGVNPVKGVKLPKADNISVRYLTKKEIEKLITTIQDDGNIRFLRIVKAYLHTGARRNELLPPLFTWDNVDFDERKVMINGQKSQSKRFLPMNQTLFELFTEIKDNDPKTPFNFNPDYITKKIAKYYKSAKIKGANTHSLRKTFGSLLIQNNVADIYTVSKLLGHASVKTTEKYYVDLVDDNYKSALDGLDKII